MMVLNCRSVKNKVEDLSGFISSVQVDKSFWNRVWLDGSISDHEVFASSFNAYRKDRSSQGGRDFHINA